MPLINRMNMQDAEKILNHFIPDATYRHIVLDFIAKQIIFAHKIDDSNWNLNLDKNGNFLRFNIGHEYCIQIAKHEILLLLIKNYLDLSKINRIPNAIFLGYKKNKKVLSVDLSKVPDCLSRVPNSVGCIVHDKDFGKYIHFITNANKKFIQYAIRNTKILPAMKLAHSLGAIQYIEKVTNKNLPSPNYSISSENLKHYEEKFQKELKRLSLKEIEKRISQKENPLSKMVVKTSQYVRDPFVAEYAKRIANGICQDCNKPAPFINKKTGEPFLEIHHIIPLSKGGTDTIDNVIALCPNCHRKRHYG